MEGVRPVSYVPGRAVAGRRGKSAQVLVPRFLANDDVAALLAGLPELEYVQLLSAGAEIWVGKLPEHVLLSTCRGAHGGSTAEWVVGGLLALYRDFPRFQRAQERHEWDYHMTDTLQDKRVLIVGAGDLGDQLARRLAPFDATSTWSAGHARDGVHGIDELPELLGQHDATVLMVPLTSRDDADGGRRVPGRHARRRHRGERGARAGRRYRRTGRRAAHRAAARRARRHRPGTATGRSSTLDDGRAVPHPARRRLVRRVGRARAWRVAVAEIARYARGEQPRNLVHGEY